MAPTEPCEACATAMKVPRIDLFLARCESCSARAIAALGLHKDSQELGTMTPDYKRLLAGIFRSRWKEGAELVKAWGSMMDVKRWS